MLDWFFCFIDSFGKHEAGITVLSTVVLAIFTIALVRVTKRLWIETRDAGETAKVSAWAAARSAEIAQVALVQTNRAFVFAFSIRAYPEASTDIPGEHNWRFRPILRNSGKTNTRGLVMKVDCFITGKQITDADDLALDHIPIGVGFFGPEVILEGGLAPSNEKGHERPAITPRELVDARDGKRFLYMVGWIRYCDTYSEDIHQTGYCWAIAVQGDPFSYDPLAIGVPPTPGTLSFSTIHQRPGNYANTEPAKKEKED